MSILRKSRNLANQIAGLSALIPRNRLINLLKHWQFSTVIDAGSHDGTWSKDVVPFLNLTEKATLLLIDPITDPLSKNLRILAEYVDITLHKVALGNEPGSAVFNIASNKGESSSFLEFAPAHLDAAPNVSFEEASMIPIVQLDALTENISSPILLKLDLQGYEMHALKGAVKTLENVEVLVIEASLVETYLGGSTLKTLIHHLELCGFKLVGLVESFSEKNYGRMIQMDAVFSRS